MHLNLFFLLVMTFVKLSTASASANFSIEDGYDILFSNSEINDAQVILIGSRHGDFSESNFGKNFVDDFKIIDSLGAFGDVLLFEGVPWGRQLFHNSPMIDEHPHIKRPSGIQVMGWDHIPLAQQSETLNEMVTSGFENAKTLSEAESVMAMALAYDELAVVLRNRHLLKAILATRDHWPDKKIFVTSGSSHVGEPELLQFFKNSSLLPSLVLRKKNATEPPSSIPRVFEMSKKIIAQVTEATGLKNRLLSSPSPINLNPASTCSSALSPSN